MNGKAFKFIHTKPNVIREFNQSSTRHRKASNKIICKVCVLCCHNTTNLTQEKIANDTNENHKWMAAKPLNVCCLLAFCSNAVFQFVLLFFVFLFFYRLSCFPIVCYCICLQLEFISSNERWTQQTQFDLFVFEILLKR